jgi:Uma2 family endonuclease
MAAHTIEYVNSIAHLPDGSTLILSNVSWDEYEGLIENLGDWPGVRVSYDQSKLEIATPTAEHERLKVLVCLLAHMLADETGIVLESFGSTTFKQEWLQRGVESDGCFYVHNAASMIGVRDIDLKIDPPPDIVVEMDVCHDSTHKLRIYAGMGVAEVWRYDGKRAHIYLLVGQDYVAVDTSKVLPVFTTDVLARFLEQGIREGQTATKRSFRNWLRSVSAG